jgi:hypothetical protein
MRDMTPSFALSLVIIILSILAALFLAHEVKAAVDVNVELTPAQKAVCDAEGGCVFTTRNAIRSLVIKSETEAYERGKQAGAEECAQK